MTQEGTDYIAGIGTNAGVLWQALSASGAQTLGALQKSTRLPDAALREAMGWLAREGKISIEPLKGKGLKLQLVQPS